LIESVARKRIGKCFVAFQKSAAFTYALMVSLGVIEASDCLFCLLSLPLVTRSGLEPKPKQKVLHTVSGFQAANLTHFFEFAKQKSKKSKSPGNRQLFVYFLPLAPGLVIISEGNIQNPFVITPLAPLPGVHNNRILSTCYSARSLCMG
jgi:hypothetical protein